MDAPGILHVIAEDLTQNWLDEAADAGVEAIEAYLAKHLAFLSYLDAAAAERR